jgi:7-carboxy-7-deazaguanine synthase
MKINEIFMSSQGEGLTVGKPSIFIRLANCNMFCKKCDTKFALHSATEVSVKAIESKIKNYKCRNLVITGGEPLLQPELVNLLLRFFTQYHITVETNCTIFRDELVPMVNFWSVSPKLSGMGGALPFDPNIFSKYYKLRTIGKSVQFKFVIADKKDLEEVKNIIKGYKDIVVVLQPNEQRFDSIPRYLQKCKDLLNWVFNDEIFATVDVRVIPQLHKLYYGNKRGV